MTSRRAIGLLASLVCAAAHAGRVTVNAAEQRSPIATEIYEGALGDEPQQAELAAGSGLRLSAGELARVELLGVLGQRGFTGARSQPAPSAALELYTNYDGRGARFGATSIRATSDSPSLAAFAAFDLDANVTVVLVNESTESTSQAVVDFQGIGQKGGWRAFELTAEGRISPVGAGTIYDAQLVRTVRPYTAVLLEYRPVGGILPIRAQVVLPAAGDIEARHAMGCSATDLGYLSLGLLALVGLMRLRARY